MFAFGCSTAPQTADQRSLLNSDVDNTVQRMSNDDPSFKPFIDNARAYVVFPSVGKGAAGIGGAYGRGEVFDQGHFIGYADISQGTLGVQLGGQAFSEVIAFETGGALDRFKSGQFAFDANASAVALKSGAAATSRYTNGVTVFTDPVGGLMFEASIGGQNFSFQPSDENYSTPQGVARTE
jgi:lipid-binding SYLF domain-containing protein